jgi:hypothetical protein
MPDTKSRLMIDRTYHLTIHRRYQLILRPIGWKHWIEKWNALKRWQSFPRIRAVGLEYPDEKLFSNPNFE